MQGLEQSTMAVVSAQPPENSVMKSQMWNESKEKFLKGEPKVLGAVQVMIALINFSLGIIMMANTSSERHISVFLMAPIWGSMMFIISGFLSIAAGVNTTKTLVISSLSLNTISSVLAAATSIIGVISVLVGVSRYFNNQPVTNGVDALMLILNLLEFCIAVSVSAFGCRASCCNSSEVLVVLTPNPAATVTVPPMTLQQLPPSEHQGKNVPENLYNNYPGELV
ncbi:membrane-spanning 4-domains subfamily A member 4D-like [Mastomys coucha]|uniref:membrane-spanning 4-domains subfamily A member 4D-like n=1 Tax=Mastomys coucha TaxID=35658 RepID=UPI001261B4CF|nr:membrane-spanning 4-domains subfamily A member 4D-like [Mastomys coucha]XP_031245635.1 membrane-spanning 4-domains subfamily A member 4D-like [Mastomys coucha]